MGEVESRPGAVSGPDISIVVFSNNNERCIRRCIQSIVSQRGSFTYEVVLVDAASSDYTVEIAAEIFSGTAGLTYRAHRGAGDVWRGEALVELFSGLHGRYTAFISGDDEWIRPTKLQDQIAFLDTHRECFGCVSNYLMRHEATARFRARTIQDDKTSFAQVSELIRNNLVWSVSAAVFRTELLKQVKLCATPFEHLAWVLALQLSSSGLLGIMHVIMAVANDWGSHPEQARREINRSLLLAYLREYDQLTGGTFSEDFQALAGALRAEIAAGAAW